MSHHTDPFGPAIHTGNVWLRTVADRPGSDDRMTAQLPTSLRRVLLGADFSDIPTAAGIFETPEGRP
ncbi:hypothetical protein [Nocardia tengchongensis]|uniref:hypothetical protein n=1 Tax=Nocardia tengchongensis TaxID=2055889 RepID=UPI00360D7F72